MPIQNYTDGVPSAWDAPLESATENAASAISRSGPKRIAGRLPEPSRSKFLAWCDLAEELHAAASVASEAEREHHVELQKAKADLAAHTDPLAASASGVHLGTVGQDIVAKKRATVETMEAELTRLRDRSDLATHRSRVASMPVRICEAYLKGLPDGVQLKPYDAKPPALRKEETLLQACERFRKQVAQLRADEHTVNSAPYPSSVAKAKLREQIETLAREAQPNLLPLVEEERGEIAWPKQLIDTHAYQIDTRPSEEGGGLPMRAVVHPYAVSAPRLLAWLFRDEMLAKLEKELDVLADDGAALTAEARVDKLAKIASDILKAERGEEYFATEAEGQGQVVERRDDVSALALLGIEETKNSSA